MSDEVKTVPPYDPSDPSKVLNPHGYPYILGINDNVGKVPSYDALRLGAHPGGITQPSPPPVMDSDWPALVSGAGKTTVNGLYAYLDPTSWKYSQYTMKKMPYPDPNVPVWTILQGSSIFYYGENTTLPWETTVWHPGLGSAPAPTVVKQQPTRSAEKESKSEEPKKKKKFFTF